MLLGMPLQLVGSAAYKDINRRYQTVNHTDFGCGHQRIGTDDKAIIIDIAVETGPSVGAVNRSDR